MNVAAALDPPYLETYGREFANNGQSDVKYPRNIPTLKATASVIKDIKNTSSWEKSEIVNLKTGN